jgi:DNA-binding XRE family transcriptional regulator
VLAGPELHHNLCPGATPPGAAASAILCRMPDPDQPALGAAVKAIREQKKISQVALSRATGFRQSWVSAVEHGRHNPSFTNLVRLAGGLGVKTSTLVRRAENLASHDDRDAR